VSTTETSIHSVDLPTGVRLEYVEQGDPDGAPVVMLHGFTDSWRSYEPVLPLLPDGIRAVAVTQRGHGESGRPDSGYRIADLAADVVALIEALELDRPIVVGHSMGAWVALQVAIGAPSSVSALVLEGTFGRPAGNPVLEEFAREVAQLEEPVAYEFAREFQAATTTQPIPEELLDMVSRESVKLPARLWRTLAEGFMEIDFTARLGSIEVPTLLLWGDQDAFIPRADQDYLLAGIPGSRLTVYEGTGHSLHWEQRERWVADVAAFIAENGGSPA
jgi:pimeloyl-ACP methyl ester carboxylesterase